MMRWRMLTTSIAVWLLAGCGAAPRGPESIPMDRVNCARCGMLISSDANAAQLQRPGEATRFYDDTGCLAADPDARAQDARRYVHLAAGRWETTDAAWFAQPPGVKTPMDYGVVAFATEREAQEAGGGPPRQWPAIVRAVEAP